MPLEVTFFYTDIVFAAYICLVNEFNQQGVTARGASSQGAEHTAMTFAVTFKALSLVVITSHAGWFVGAGDDGSL